MPSPTTAAHNYVLQRLVRLLLTAMVGTGGPLMVALISGAGLAMSLMASILTGFTLFSFHVFLIVRQDAERDRPYRIPLRAIEPMDEADVRVMSVVPDPGAPVK